MQLKMFRTELFWQKCWLESNVCDVSTHYGIKKEGNFLCSVGWIFSKCHRLLSLNFTFKLTTKSEVLFFLDFGFKHVQLFEKWERYCIKSLVVTLYSKFDDRQIVRDYISLHLLPPQLQNEHHITSHHITSILEYTAFANAQCLQQNAGLKEKLSSFMTSWGCCNEIFANKVFCRSTLHKYVLKAQHTLGGFG